MCLELQLETSIDWFLRERQELCLLFDFVTSFIFKSLPGKRTDFVFLLDW